MGNISFDQQTKQNHVFNDEIICVICEVVNALVLSTLLILNHQLYYFDAWSFLISTL